MQPKNDTRRSLQTKSQNLKERIDRLTQRHQPSSDKVRPAYSLGKAARLGIEFISGVLIGVGLGIFVDRWLESSPWGLISGFLLGSFAGFWNIRRVLLSVFDSTHKK
ncbi:MAG: AtpZ/AtpI family protein [Alphaproteobacteria bacterium]